MIPEQIVMNTTSFSGNYTRDEHPLPNKTGRTGMYLNYFIIKTVDKWLCVYGILAGILLIITCFKFGNAEKI